MTSFSLFTYVLNLFALSLAIWLGFYVITYSPRRLISWLTGLTLWSISGIFLNMLLAITPPPPPQNLQSWQVMLFPFWSPQVFQNGVGGWLAGWLATPAIAIWHHITILLRDEKSNKWFKLQVLVVYILAGVTIYSQLNSTLMFSEASGDPLRLNYLKPGIYYSVFMSLLIVIAGISANNLFVAQKKVQSDLIRRQLNSLFIATCFAGLTGPISLFALFDQFTIPRVVNTILLTATIAMIGISITRYSALIEGRLIRKDLIYNASIISLILLLYLGITWLAVKLFGIPRFIYIYVAVIAIISHSVVDIARRYLGRLFLRREEQDLRIALHRLARTETLNIGETVTIMLESLCSTIRATNGTLFLFKDEQVIPTACCNQTTQECPFDIEALTADDVLHTKPNHFPEPFSSTTLLVPLYYHADQIGTILFGHPVNGIDYPESDLDLILESSDLIAEVIANSNHQQQRAAQTAEMLQTLQATSPSDVKITPKMVEALLRNVLDYGYLGRSDFAGFPIVSQMLSGSNPTHIDRGKCVYWILAEMVEKLKPEGELKRDPPPREWLPYLILHWAYFEDTNNREIMARLYISEGTFNRTRRAALRTLSRALEEIQPTEK
jgi:hypothetical protein